jgi:hypothetical protein
MAHNVLYIDGWNRVVHVFNYTPCLEDLFVCELVYSSAGFIGSSKLHRCASFLWKSVWVLWCLFLLKLEMSYNKCFSYSYWISAIKRWCHNIRKESIWSPSRNYKLTNYDIPSYLLAIHLNVFEASSLLRSKCKIISC